MEIVIYGYFGKGNLGDEALAEVWCGALSPLGEVRTVAPPRPPHAETVVFTGEPLQDRTSRRSLLFYAAAIRMASRRGQVVLGAVGADLRSRLKRLLPWALRGAAYISVRDPCSLKALSALGIAAKETRDPALLLDPPPANHRGPVLLNLVPSLPPEARHKALKLAREAAHILGRRLQGLVMARGEDERALMEMELISPHTPREALEAIGDAALVVGARLHALELSLVAGTPFVAVPYAPKVLSFLELVERDLPGCIPRIPGGGAWEQVLDPGYLQALRRARERLREEAREGVEDVVRFLRKDA